MSAGHFLLKEYELDKTLIIVAHPDLGQSTVNQSWVKALRQHPERFTVHELYAQYPDGKINVDAEQRLVEQHAHLVLQFPVYWFSSPPLLKQWQDEVLTYGWAYGSKGKKLQDKKIGVAVSAGTPVEDYRKEGAIGHTLPELLLPLECTVRYVNGSWQPPFIFYGIDSNAGYDEAALKHVEQSADDYLAHLEEHFR